MNSNAMRVVLEECDLMRQTSLRETDIDNPTASLECRCAKQSNLQNIRHAPKSTEVSDTHSCFVARVCPPFQKFQ